MLMFSRCLIFCVYLLVLSGKSVFAEKNEFLLRKVSNAELGEVFFSISCGDAVKPVFNRAVALLHSFEYDQARNVFKAVQAREPDCAMAFWGEAMTYLHVLWAPPSESEFKIASRAVAKAQKINTSTPEEKSYINALAQYFDRPWVDAERDQLAPSNCHGVTIGVTPHREKLLAYSEAMSRMYQSNTANIEAALFYALSLVALAKPNDDTYSLQLKAGEVMQAFVDTHPGHPGLAHYIIHAYDMPSLARRALGAAKSYAAIAPDSAHARHMPSHIFQRLGMWQDSIRSNLASTESARRYAARVNMQGNWDEELHGLDFLTNAYMQAGEYKSAEKIRDYIASMKSFYPENFKVAYVLSATPARFELDRKNWEGAAALTVSHPRFPWVNFPWEKAIMHFAIGYGHVRLGNIPEATEQLDTLKKLKEQLVFDGNKSLAARVDIQALKLSAWVYLSAENAEQALQTMHQAATLEWETVIPTGAILPGYEMLGDMYLELKKYVQAIEMYEKSLTRDTGRRNAFQGIRIAAKAIGDERRYAKYSLGLNDISSRSGGL